MTGGVITSSLLTQVVAPVSDCYLDDLVQRLWRDFGGKARAASRVQAPAARQDDGAGHV